MLKLLLFAFIFLPNFLIAQTEPQGTSAAEIMATSRDSEMEADNEELLDAAQIAGKYDLNTITKDKLLAIPGITAHQATNLVSYRLSMGAFQHIYELQCVPGWSASFCRKMRLYFTVSNPEDDENVKKRVAGGSHSFSAQLSRVLQKSAGYNKIDSSGPAYPGSPLRLLLRYRYNNPRKMQWGFLAEKDAGERMFGGPVKGIDHYSFFMLMRNWKKFEMIILGDYRVNLGQGMVQWQSLAFNKGADIVNTMRQGEALRPNQSATESGYYRGFAVSRRFNRLYTLVFFSRMKMDANIKVDSINGVHVSSLLYSGLHRTKSEFSDRKALDHAVAGASVNYKVRGIKMGANVVAHSFNKPIIKADEPYNHFAFTGMKLLNQSFDYALPLGNLRLFGELAFSHLGGYGMVNGLLMSIARNADLALLYRNISPSYRSFESSAFTEASEPSGERGLFAGVHLKISPVLNLSAFADHFMFPFYRYQLHGAARGNSYSLQWKLVPDKKSYCTVRFSMERKSANNTDEEFIHTVGIATRKSLRIQAGYPLGRNCSGSSRVEVAETGKEDIRENAMLIYSEVAATILNNYKGVFRLQLIDIPSYNSRLYAYESSGASSGFVRMHYGSGVSLSARIKRNISRNFLVWASVSSTFFKTDAAMGTGNDRLEGRQKTFLNVQAVVTF